MEPIKRQRTATQSSTSIRGKLNDQLSKLTAKHNAEVELLEDLKLFSRQKAVLEKQYAEGLHRLVTQFASKRDIRPPPNVAGFEKHENRGLLEVWKALLEKTDEISKRRSTMSDLLNTQVSDVAKRQKRIKEANFKRLIEVCQKINSEILESSKELTTTKKSYGDLEKVCEDARSKYNEAETRLKKRDLKFFETMSGLEKNHAKASDRLKSCQKRTTASRNDYWLAVAMANAHLKRHGTKDLPNLMQAMDGEMYDKVRNAYSMYAQIEADMAIFVKAEFEDLVEQAYLVNREYVLECYLHNNPVLGELQGFKFEPYGEDTVMAMSRDHGAEIFLDKDARKWANTLTKEQMSIATLQKQVKGLQSVTSAYTKNPEFGTSDAQAEAFLKTDMMLEEIRQLQVQTTKAEARLEALRQAGIDISKWLQKAEKTYGDKSTSVSSSSELTPNTSYNSLSHGRVSQLSLPSSIGSSQDFDVETSSVNSAHDDTTSLESGRSAESLPKFCSVIYDYTAQRPDELHITEGEELEVIEWDDGDGWCKGKNKSGQEGYFPQSYVKTISRPSSPTPGPAPTNTSPDVTTPTQQIISAVPLPQATPIQSTPVPSVPQSDSETAKVWVKALYDYTAQFDEELSFPEGALIVLLRTDDNGVDDGWWEGSYQGKVGVFPSVVVETCGDDTCSPSELNSTLTPDCLSYPPPPLDSPPPLPPDYPPPPLSPVHANGVGPAPRLVTDSSAYHTVYDDMNTPVNFTSDTPLKRGVEPVKMDSFDSDSDFEMV